ncbi:MAG: hypothetical protein IPL61_17600 [Myxococcales bacterium]|nr:hypothetical protein [Myxococcales bacterium]
MSPDARWDTFLARIQARSDELLAEAHAGSIELLDQTDDDVLALGQAWTGIRSRMLALRAMISDTWSDQVGDLFPDPAASDRAHARGAACAATLERDFDRGEVHVWAEVGRRIVARAAAMRVAEAACGHCGHAISAVAIRRTHEWTCAACRATATFQPSTYEYQLEAAADYIARERALELEPAMLAARLAGDADRTAAEAYWRVYLAAVAEVLPERAATLADDLAARLARAATP